MAVSERALVAIVYVVERKTVGGICIRLHREWGMLRFLTARPVSSPTLYCRNRMAQGPERQPGIVQISRL